MPKLSAVLTLIIAITCLGASAQEKGTSSPAVNESIKLKTIVVSASAPSDSAIAIPPATSVTFDRNPKNAVADSDRVDLKSWISTVAALNGLESSALRPWHIVIAFDRFDEDGDDVQSGTFEEYWAGPTKFKRSYKSPDFSQTDYATDKGLFRVGNQRWPNQAEAQVRAEVLDPFAYAATLQDSRGRSMERNFNGYTLHCTLIEKNAGVSDPTQYCFEPNSSTLRYARGFGWFQTVYNRIVTFQGRNIAEDVDVTNAGKPYLKLRIQSIELIPQVDDAVFQPPADTIGPLGDRVTGISRMPIKTAYPEWPSSLNGQRFTVTVEIVIGKNGHVTSAHGVSGPQAGYKACENAVRKWVFTPYLVLGKPVEVEQKVQCAHN